MTSKNLQDKAGLRRIMEYLWLDFDISCYIKCHIFERILVMIYFKKMPIFNEKSPVNL